jgi:hypothetical protein
MMIDSSEKLALKQRVTIKEQFHAAVIKKPRQLTKKCAFTNAGLQKNIC